MNIRDTYFLAVLKAALQGTTAPSEVLTEEDWQALLQMAQRHQVLPLFCQAAPIPGHLTGHKGELRRQVALQTLKTCQFLTVYQALRDAGTTPLVVKGILCRSLYPQPDLRPSSDEDLLLPQEQWDTALAVLEGLGMVGQIKGHELAFQKPGEPLSLELHRHLIPPDTRAYGHWNRFLEDIWKRAEEVTIQGVSILAPHPTDHLFYLICHALKHFLHSGFGIRQVCDLILFANTYGPQIRWEQIIDQCSRIRADRFAAALFRIGKNYLNFDPGHACYPETWQALDIDEAPLLEDILSAGIYGNATLSRQHSSNMTLDAAGGENHAGSLLGSLFPGRERLLAQYPYLETRPYLLPLAWGQRLWHYGKELQGSGAQSPAEAVRIGNRRVALLQQYGLVP